MRGRKPKLRVVDGSFEPPDTPAPCPAAPSWLTAEAVAEWNRAAPEIHSRGLLTQDVLASLESYCVAVGSVRELEALMTREGRVVWTEGGLKAHPAFRMQTAAMREARLLASELGLTPHRRAAKGRDAEPAGDRWGGMLG